MLIDWVVFVNFTSTVHLVNYPRTINTVHLRAREEPHSALRRLLGGVCGPRYRRGKYHIEQLSVLATRKTHSPTQSTPPFSKVIVGTGTPLPVIEP